MSFNISNDNLYYEDELNYPIVNGDLLDVEAGVIIHSVNCMGVMGSGVAKQIRDKYPEHYRQYLLNCVGNIDKKRSLLGTSFFTIHKKTNGTEKDIENFSDDFLICGIFGQFDYNRSGKTSQQTEYSAFFSALTEIYLYSSINIEKLEYYIMNPENISINIVTHAFRSNILYMPYKIGCGLGGGDWKEMKQHFNDFQQKYPTMPIVFVKK